MFFNHEDNWKHFDKLLDWITELIKQVSLINQVSPDASYLYNFFLIVVSLFAISVIRYMVTIMCLIIVGGSEARKAILSMVKTAIQGTGKEIKKAVEWIKRTWKGIMTVSMRR